MTITDITLLLAALAQLIAAIGDLTDAARGRSADAVSFNDTSHCAQCLVLLSEFFRPARTS